MQTPAGRYNSWATETFFFKLFLYATVMTSNEKDNWVQKSWNNSVFMGSEQHLNLPENSALHFHSVLFQSRTRRTTWDFWSRLDKTRPLLHCSMSNDECNWCTAFPVSPGVPRPMHFKYNSAEFGANVMRKKKILVILFRFFFLGGGQFKFDIYVQSWSCLGLVLQKSPKVFVSILSRLDLGQCGSVAVADRDNSRPHAQHTLDTLNCWHPRHSPGQGLPCKAAHT